MKLRLVGAVVLMLGARADARPTESLDAERAAAAAELRDLDRRATSLDDQLGLRQRMLRRRLRSLYKMSQGGSFRLLVDARSLDELDQRVLAAQRVVVRDLQELGALDEELSELGRDRAHRTEELAHSAGLEETRGAAMSEPATGLLRHRGQLARPVPSSITVGIGRVRVRDPRAGAPAVELPRRGVELTTTSGETVRAIAAGTVTFVGEIDGLGRAVIIDHGDRYVSVTARLGRVIAQVGERIHEGSSLGNAAGTTISFELTEGRVALDPTRWLRPPPPPIVASPLPAATPVHLPEGSLPAKAATLAE